MLVNYSSESEGEDKIKKKHQKSGILVNPNPDADITTMMVQHEALMLEQYKKDHPEEFIKVPEIKHVTGKLRSETMTDFNFNENFSNFENAGFTYDPADPTRIIVDKEKYPEFYKKINERDGITPEEAQFIFNGIYGKTDKIKTQELKKKREKFGKPQSDSFQGPWAKYRNDDLEKQAITEQQMKDNLQKIEQKKLEKQEEQKRLEEFQVTTEFHGRNASHQLPNPHTKYADHVCYIPKRTAHIYQGHTKGVQVVRFYPRFGHLLLSGSLDTTMKLWTTGERKELIRTYNGHSEAVRDLCFQWDGKHFVSAGYDKIMHYWDTEYGKVVNSYKLKSFPFCVKFNTKEENSNYFLMGSSGKKIGQYDTRTGSRTLVYDEHLAPVNTVTLIENGKKFVSSSDDKKIFVWEFGIPVCIKHVSEPDQHATTSAAMHPQQQYYAGQCNNNVIQIYDTKGGIFRKNTKRKFVGHKSTSYSIGICFSPDGQFIASGDSEGKAYSQKIFRVFEAHDNVCNSIVWSPSEASRVATCGWDGLVKLWD